MSIFTPTNQIRLTNVSFVRLKKGGKRFEIACYKNKVQEWRRGIESDLDNVLQIEAVFTNVSKGQSAKTEELRKNFAACFENEKKKGPKGVMKEICMEILKAGQIQVSDKEREADMSSISKEIVQFLADSTVHPESKEPYPVSTIEKAVKELGLSIQTHKSAKQQAVAALRLMQEKNIIPIRRVNYRIRIKIPPMKDKQKLKERIIGSQFKLEKEEFDGDLMLTGVCEPGYYRIAMDIISKETKGKGRVELLQMRDVE